MEKISQMPNNTGPDLQSVWSLQISVHELKQVLTAYYANIKKKLNQVFTPHINGKQKIAQETFEFLKNG